MTPTNVQIVDEPTFPEAPVAPRKGRTLLLAALLGIFVGCGIVIAKELMNRTIRTEEDVKNYLGLAVMGSIPDEESLTRAMEVHKQIEEKKPGFISKVRDYIWKK